MHMSVSVLFVFIHVVAAAVGLGPTCVNKLPALGIDRRHIIASGHSAGADLTVQLQVAFSSWVSGACVFAGQPYHCQGTHFQDEPLVDIEDIHSCINAGTMPSAACPDCPPNKTLYVDHCKGWLGGDVNKVDLDKLVSYAKRQADAGMIDPLTKLRERKVYTAVGTMDQIYAPGTVKNTALFFEKLDVEKVRYEEFSGLMHVWPSTGEYHCLNHMWPERMMGSIFPFELQVAMLGRESHDEHNETHYGFKGGGADPLHRFLHKQENLFIFDQTEFFGSRPTGMKGTGAVYIPSGCRSPDAQCPLQLVLGGCESTWEWVIPSFFLEFAELLNIVMLMPQQGNWPPEKSRPGVWNAKAEPCWDSYGLTGTDYAIKSGVQMDVINKMVARLSDEFQEWQDCSLMSSETERAIFF